MNFFKVKRFRLNQKLKVEGTDPETNQMRAVESEIESMESGQKVGAGDGGVEEEDYDDEDDDIVSNEVKRMKEMRKNSFMVLIPEESNLEEEETSSSERRESEVEDGYLLCDFDTLYIRYCERMLFFDKLIVQNMKEAESWNFSNQSHRSARKKLSLNLKSFSFKNRDEFQDDCEQLRSPLDDDPLQSLEISYVAQICLSWEVLHCQYTQLNLRVSSQPDNPTPYGHSAQEFQQYQVLLLRFIENEPFERGLRGDIYCRTRSTLSKLLQVPKIEGSVHKAKGNEDLDPPVLAHELLSIVESSIFTFHDFLKRDKKKFTAALSFVKGHNHDASSLQQVHASLDKKEIKIKELSKKKEWRKSRPTTPSEVDLFLALIDIKVVSRVLRMARISEEQLLWCEEKMSRLDLSDNRLRRDASPVLFPC
ncbi:uncharacterized protein LOC110033045 [Phalaenopsis equestris]|uniref:uncharacterized protein LOC110033045 n=1 Tax=Phalaenopsis equestris TaxID=78828 RepID=UPI0009E19D69|nr:uncharacterized protein LOC110033045 [Phalaenopsis equestris]